MFLASWMLDLEANSLALISRAFAGSPQSLTRDDAVDNITLYWLTNTGVSSARLYAENRFSFFAVKGVKLPVAVSVFSDELYMPPRSWAEQAYPQIIHYNRLPAGGHYPAWEQPESFVGEVRTRPALTLRPGPGARSCRDLPLPYPPRGKRAGSRWQDRGHGLPASAR